MHVRVFVCGLCLVRALCVCVFAAVCRCRCRCLCLCVVSFFHRVVVRMRMFVNVNVNVCVRVQIADNMAAAIEAAEERLERYRKGCADGTGTGCY
eukprot:2037198-Rhodomonas_salina.1